LVVPELSVNANEAGDKGRVVEEQLGRQQGEEEKQEDEQVSRCGVMRH
jgi:hypothetical protein